jgi:hypothetical protein
MSIQVPSTPAQVAMLRTWEAHLDADRLPVVRREAADFLAGSAVAPNRLIDRARG